MKKYKYYTSSKLEDKHRDSDFHGFLPVYFFKCFSLSVEGIHHRIMYQVYKPYDAGHGERYHRMNEEINCRQRHIITF